MIFFCLATLSIWTVEFFNYTRKGSHKFKGQNSSLQRRKWLSLIRKGQWGCTNSFYNDRGNNWGKICPAAKESDGGFPAGLQADSCLWRDKCKETEHQGALENVAPNHYNTLWDKTWNEAEHFIFSVQAALEPDADGCLSVRHFFSTETQNQQPDGNTIVCAQLEPKRRVRSSAHDTPACRWK